MAYKKKSKKTKQQVDVAVVHIKASFNNTLVSVTTLDGDVLLRCSSGCLGFKGSRKGTPFAGSQIGAHLAKDMIGVFGIKELECNMQGAGSGKDSVVRALQACNLKISVLRDVTPLPHNGCRPSKKPRN